MRRKGTKRVVRKAPAPPSLPAEGREVVEYRQAFCPVCGRAAGKRNGRNFWEYTKDFDPNKPFGVIWDMEAPRQGDDPYSSASRSRAPTLLRGCIVGAEDDRHRIAGGGGVRAV